MSDQHDPDTGKIIEQRAADGGADTQQHRPSLT